VWSNDPVLDGSIAVTTTGGSGALHGREGLQETEAAPGGARVAGRSVRFRSNSPRAHQYGLALLSGRHRGTVTSVRHRGPLVLPSGQCAVRYGVVAVERRLGWVSDAVARVKGC
jgi:hypothetical protein